MNVAPAFTCDEAAWLDLAAVTPSLLEKLGDVQPLRDVVSCSVWRAGGSIASSDDNPCIQRLDHQDVGGRDAPSLKCLLRLVPTLSVRDEDRNNSPIVKVHPVVFECCSPSRLEDVTTDYTDASSSDGGPPVDEQSLSTPSARVTLQPITPPFSLAGLDHSSPTGEVLSWVLRKVPAQGKLCRGSVVEVEVVYLDPELEIGFSYAASSRLENLIEDALQGRWIMRSTLLVLSVRNACAVVIVHNVRSGPIVSECASLLHEAVRVGTFGTFRVVLLPYAGCESIPVAKPSERPKTSCPGSDCPGYESVADHVRNLLVMQGPPAPSGVLLMGCKGVGKTRIAGCVAAEIAAASNSWDVHSVSLYDVLQMASWATEDVLFMQLVPSLIKSNKEKSRYLVVVDDIDVLSLPDSDSISQVEPDRRLLLNSLLQAIDLLVEAGHSILGVSQDGAAGSRLPPELVKASRFEKLVVVQPTSQYQRERILDQMLSDVGVDDASLRQSWSVVIAGRTPGCVAADLRRLCTDAWTRAVGRFDEYVNGSRESAASSILWEDLCDAARDCIPSQLAMLDVIKPHRFSFEENLSSPGGWLRMHQASWASFAGYESIIRRIYRTIVAPWRRHLHACDLGAAVESIKTSPPSGVLFHGAAGVGKTLAATCLGSSLELPMIRVRSSDVLDKYLGGSEAVVRSLFARARAASPVILLFDEIDSIAGNRDNDETGTGVMSRILSTLLNEMDGVSSRLRHSVLVVACTNRLSAIDAALLRPGRLEEHIEFPLPTIDDLHALLRHFLRNVTMDRTVDLRILATRLKSRNATAAGVEGVAREAVLLALRRDHVTPNDVSLQASDFENAIQQL
jgi:ATP-dependent 26S proteasome regulatory subunit